MFIPREKLSPVNLCLVSHMFLPVKNSPWNLCLVSHVFLPRKKLFPVKCMLGVPYVCSSEKVFPCDIYAWCPICFFPWKTIHCEIYAWCPICLFQWKGIPLWYLRLVFLGGRVRSRRCNGFAVLRRVRNCRVWLIDWLIDWLMVSHMFLPREKLSPVKFLLGVLYVSSPWKTIPVKCMLGVSHLFFRRLNRPLCRLRLWRWLTRDVHKRVTVVGNLLLLLCVRSWRAVC